MEDVFLNTIPNVRLVEAQLREQATREGKSLEEVYYSNPLFAQTAQMMADAQTAEPKPAEPGKEGNPNPQNDEPEEPKKEPSPLDSMNTDPWG